MVVSHNHTPVLLAVQVVVLPYNRGRDGQSKDGGGHSAIVFHIGRPCMLNSGSDCCSHGIGDLLLVATFVDGFKVGEILLW